MVPATSRWRDLLQEAFGILDHVNREFEIIESWSFGGGTAMMIQIDHRESHDIDLFLDDPQLLPYVESTVSERQFALGKATYNGDGTGHLKIAFEGIGEIDFIVTGHVTEVPTSIQTIEGRAVALETVPEIIAKKVRYRGSRIQPRDIFDIAAAAATNDTADVIAALALIPDYVRETISRIDVLSRDYVSSSIAQLALREQNKHLVDSAYDDALGLLREV